MVQSSLHNNSVTETDQKIKIVWDVDDVIIKTSEYIINELNKKYNIIPSASIYDLKDWGYRSIITKISKKEDKERLLKDKSEIWQMFASDEFWENVQIREGFLDIWNDIVIRDNYEFVFASKGTDENLTKKEKFLKEKLGTEKITFIGMNLCAERGQSENHDKSFLDIEGGIQIDDRYSCLNTNAALKILLKNYIDTSYNTHIEERDDLYEINSLEEFKELLIFNVINGNILLRGE